MAKEKPTQCYICKGELDYLGQVPVRTHGESGLSVLVFGGLAEAGEEKWPIDIFRCKECGHLEMYDLDFSLKKIS